VIPAVKDIVVAVVLSATSLGCGAVPPECDMQRFPESWSAAQSRVVWLNSFLEATERNHAFASASVQPFRQVVGMCRTKRESASDDARAPATAGVVSQMRCEALLICARIGAIELP